MTAANSKDMMRRAKRRAILQFSALRFGPLLILCWAVCGCSFLQPETVAYDKILAGYEQTKLKTSGSLDVLGAMRTPQDEAAPGSGATRLISQSGTAVASLAQSKKGYKTCFAMVAFDEHTMTARRKYFYLVDERVSVPPTQPMRLLSEPKRGLRFACQVVLPIGVVAKPYPSDKAKQAAILKQLGETFRQDIQELAGGAAKAGQGNQLLTVSGMVMNQIFEAVLLELERSSAPAEQLADEGGIEFPHINFDKGRIRLTVQEDIATVNIGLGLFRHDFEQAKAATATESERSPREWFYFIASQSDSI
jgi:hypothetical protein